MTFEKMHFKRINVNYPIIFHIQYHLKMNHGDTYDFKHDKAVWRSKATFCPYLGNLLQLYERKSCLEQGH